MTRRFLLVGLTGGIATGKSTVSDMLRALGGVVIDADLLARDVVAPGQPALAAIVQEFGPDVLQADGTLDRKRLAAVAFADPERRRRLEAITHPAIRDGFQARLAELEAQGFTGLVFWDAAVLIESGGHKAMDRLVVVITDAATQHARSSGRYGIDADRVVDEWFASVGGDGHGHASLDEAETGHVECGNEMEHHPLAQSSVVARAQLHDLVLPPHGWIGQAEGVTEPVEEMLSYACPFEGVPREGVGLG